MFQSYHILVPGINNFETVWIPLIYTNMEKLFHFCDIDPVLSLPGHNVH